MGSRSKRDRDRKRKLARRVRNRAHALQVLRRRMSDVVLARWMQDMFAYANSAMQERAGDLLDAARIPPELMKGTAPGGFAQPLAVSSKVYRAAHARPEGAVVGVDRNETPDAAGFTWVTAMDGRPRQHADVPRFPEVCSRCMGTRKIVETVYNCSFQAVEREAPCPNCGGEG